MAEDSGKLVLLPKFPIFNASDPEMAAELQKIYDSINLLAEAAEGIVTSEDYSQDQRAAFWAEGNTVNCKLAIMSRKLVKYRTQTYPGDIVREVPGTVAAGAPEYWVPPSTITPDGDWRPFGMCIDNVAAGQVAYVYTKGVVPFTKFALAPGRIYGVYHDLDDGPYKSLFVTEAVYHGANNHNISMVGIAISPNSILLQMQIFG